MKKRKFLLLSPLFLILGVGIILISGKKTSTASACNTENLSGEFIGGEVNAYIDGEEVLAPKLAVEDNNPDVLGVADNVNKWIEIDLSEQKLRAWNGDQLFLETLVSTGLPWYPTPTGEYRIWIKLRSTKMEGGEGKYYYYLPNVPFVMFFSNESTPGYLGYGLHGTYWHNDFGTQRSHGCVNLPTSAAEKLYYWTSPVNESGRWTTYSSADNPGTRIVIHD